MKRFVHCVLLIATSLAWPGYALASKNLRIGGLIEESSLWREWRTRFVADAGNVVDNSSGAVSHSEGQGYGMLLAAAAGDRATFDRMWTWTKSSLQRRGDALFSWRWDPARNVVTDPNNAADGDILIAWALAEGADLWREPAYEAAAAAIAADIGRKLIATAPKIGPVLMPGAFGFAAGDQPDGPVVNLSYWVFPAFGRLKQLAPEHDWDGLKRSGLAIADSFAGAPADWISLAGGRIHPAQRFPALSGYDALRVPLYLAMSGDDHVAQLAQSDAAAPLRGDGLAIVDLKKGVSESIASGRGFRAVAALRACVASGHAMPRDFYRLAPDDAYYPATLQMLAIVGALAGHENCLDPVEARSIRAADWRPHGATLPTASRARAAPQAPAVTFFAGAPSIAQPETAEAVRGDGDDAGLAWGGFLLAGVLGVFGWRMSGLSGGARNDLEDIMHAGEKPAPARSAAPRCLPQNPFLQARGLEALAQRVEIAAAASAQWRRTVAVAYFRLVDFDISPDASAAAIERIAQAIRTRIRQSDAVVEIGPAELAVCLSLIADDRDLAAIASRLSAAVRAVQPLKDKSENIFGLALYPAKNGSGEACIEAARRDFHEKRPGLDFAPRTIAKRGAPRAARRRNV